MVKFNFQPLKQLHFFIYAQARLLFLHRQEQNNSLIFVLPACLRISFQTQGVVIEFSHLLLRYYGDIFESNSPLYLHWHSISPGAFPENYLCDPGVVAELPSCIGVTPSDPLFKITMHQTRKVVLQKQS